MYNDKTSDNNKVSPKDEGKFPMGKDITLKSLQKALIGICIFLGLVLISLVVYGSNDQTISADEIDKNSQEWEVLQEQIDFQMDQVREAQDKQFYLEERNGLLRELFMEGKNQ